MMDELWTIHRRGVAHQSHVVPMRSMVGSMGSLMPLVKAHAPQIL